MWLKCTPTDASSAPLRLDAELVLELQEAVSKPDKSVSTGVQNESWA